MGGESRFPTRPTCAGNPVIGGERNRVGQPQPTPLSYRSGSPRPFWFVERYRRSANVADPAGCVTGPPGGLSSVSQAVGNARFAWLVEVTRQLSEQIFAELRRKVYCIADGQNPETFARDLFGRW